MFGYADSVGADSFYIEGFAELVGFEAVPGFAGDDVDDGLQIGACCVREMSASLAEVDEGVEAGEGL